MSELHKCESCGYQSSIYTHTLTPGLVTALVKFKRATLYHGRYSIHRYKDTDPYPFKFTSVEQGNLTMLRFLGLIAHDEAKGKGWWLLTRRGSDFLKGAEVPAKVRTLNNEVLHDREPDGQYYVTISEVMNDESRSWFTEIEHLEREALPVETSQASFGFNIPVPLQRDMRSM